MVKMAQTPRFWSRIVEGTCRRIQSSETISMAFEAILNEVDQLHSVSTRLEGLAEQHPPMSEALVTIAGNVRNAATVVAVLVTTRSPKPM
jgi:hypothetical protein